MWYWWGGDEKENTGDGGSKAIFFFHVTQLVGWRGKIKNAPASESEKTRRG